MIIGAFRLRRLLPTGFAALLLACVAVAGCGGGESQKGEGDGAKADSTTVDSTKVDSAKAAEKKKVPEGVPVKVAVVEWGSISDHIEYSATVEAEGTVDVYAQASGLVRRVLSEEGDRVVAGQVLVELVDEDLKLAAADARLSFEKLESEFRRKEEMFSRDLLSKQEYEHQRFGLEQTRIRWERAKLAVAHASVRSPMAGVVAERKVKLGDRIGPTNKLFVLVDMRSLIARVHVPGRDMRSISVGQPAKLTTDFLPDRTFDGRILRISPVVDPSSGTFKVTLDVADGDGLLRPGMFVSAHIVTATHGRAVLVPKRAVVYDDGHPHVFVVADSTAKKTQLQVGFDDTESLEVLAGVQGGDSIVVVGQNGLKDNAKIRIIEGEGLRIPAKPDTTESDSTEVEG